MPLVTARPDFAPPWLARPHATLLTLGRLGRAECAQLVAGVAASHGLSAETVAAIVAKTDGVPLFVEELTKSVMESAGEDSAAVPATLKDSLMARLDRLGEAREVAQIAAVIGRQFALRAARRGRARSDGAELEAALAKLVAAGIVFPEGRGLERSFSFKHALVRDAAYESLLLAAGANGTSASPARSKNDSPNWRRTSRNCWPIISARPDWPARPAIIACAPAISAVSRSAYHGSDRAFLGGSQDRPRRCRTRPSACAANWIFC